VPHDVKFDRDAIAAVHVARHPRDVERLAAVVRFTIEIISAAILPTSINRPTCSEPCSPTRSRSACQQASSVRAGSASGRSKLLAVEHILPRAVEAVFSSTHPPQEMPLARRG